MKIKELKINGFGKLENKEINLSENINLIYGKNEAGKTSLLKFISGMFYGISKNKNKKEISDFDKYKPWGGEEFSGKLNYKLDNNEEYEIFRDFSKKNPKLYCNGEDVSKRYNIDKTKGNEFFYEQTKIDETMLFSTSLVEQKEVVLDNNNQSILTQKIANILSTGEENTSYKKTMETLNKRLIEEVGTDRTVGRPLNIIQEKINRISSEKNNLKINENKINELEIKKQNDSKKILEKEIKINLIKKLKNKYEDNNLEDEKIKINNNLIEEENIKINNLENKINEIKSNKKDNYLFKYILLLILIIINIILFIFKLNKIINIILIIFTLLFIGYIIFKKIIYRKNNIEINKQKNKYLSEIEIIKNNIEKMESNIKKINAEKAERNNLEKSKIKNEFKNKIDDDEIDYLLNADKNEINKILSNLENETSMIKVQQYTNDIDYNNIIIKLEAKAKLEEALQTAIEDKNDLLQLEKCINISKQALENAYNKMKNEVTPKFTRDLSDIVKQISSGKYDKIKYIDGEGLIVELENGEYVNANKLSIGTIDQLYLSLRLSAMQEITDEQMPIIMDETFAYYDNERLENVLNYLNEIAAKRQIIVFTCSNREKELMEKNGISFNYINL